ncbi:MAG: DrmB family protein [Coriobacteriia bacterium]
MKLSDVRVGEMRPSQLLWAYGPGAVVDLPNFSVVVKGLDYWEPSRCTPLKEPRLLAAVKNRLGWQVEKLLAPPTIQDGGGTTSHEEAGIGVPVATFPRWLRCPFCGLLADVETGLFTFKTNPYRLDRIQWTHDNCPKAKRPVAIASRFVAACDKGHMDDFPWRYYVHKGETDCMQPMRFYEVGASLENANLFVECGCGKKRTMVEAFGQGAADALPSCRGRHPHLGTYAKCDQPIRAMLLGASNGWFPETISVLAVPTEGTQLEQLVDEAWDDLKDIPGFDALAWYRKTSGMNAFSDFSNDAIWAAIEAKRAAPEESAADDDHDLKLPEWAAFMKGENHGEHLKDFRLSAGIVPTEFADIIDRVVRVERIREVNALTGFTRISPPEEMVDETGKQYRAPISSGNPTFVPASEVRGEGLFIAFKTDVLSNWAQEPAVRAREDRLLAAHREWRSSRHLEPLEKGFPGVTYTILHSFAHALMREIALECGYNAASIRERIYASRFGEPVSVAGVLIYTAAPDSEGTLGGLVALGEQEELGRLIAQALNSAELCSSDPLCSEHDPVRDKSLHGATCHACLFSPETSCERGNRYLDRALLVPTWTQKDTALFAGTGART